jgi:hypothetical protein
VRPPPPPHTHTHTHTNARTRTHLWIHPQHGVSPSDGQRRSANASVFELEVGEKSIVCPYGRAVARNTIGKVARVNAARNLVKRVDKVNRTKA